MLWLDVVEKGDFLFFAYVHEAFPVVVELVTELFDVRLKVFFDCLDV